MHREPFENEQKLIDEYGKQDFIDELDRMIAMAPPRRMKFIGKTGYDEDGRCITRKFIRPEGVIKLDEIVVYTDETGVRSLEVILIYPDGELDVPVSILMYGQEPLRGDKKSFQFWGGDQLVGISAEIFSDLQRREEYPERLMGLNFYRNRCART